jgi:hypothetical protein
MMKAKCLKSRGLRFQSSRRNRPRDCCSTRKPRISFHISLRRNRVINPCPCGAPHHEGANRETSLARSSPGLDAASTREAPRVCARPPPHTLGGGVGVQRAGEALHKFSRFPLRDSICQNLVLHVHKCGLRIDDALNVRTMDMWRPETAESMSGSGRTSVACSKNLRTTWAKTFRQRFECWSGRSTGRSLAASQRERARLVGHERSNQQSAPALVEQPGAWATGERTPMTENSNSTNIIGIDRRSLRHRVGLAIAQIGSEIDALAFCAKALDQASLDWGSDSEDDELRQAAQTIRTSCLRVLLTAVSLAAESGNLEALAEVQAIGEAGQEP